MDGRSSKPTIASLGLKSLTDDVDIDDYFITFVRSMRFNEIEKDQWMRYLTPHLKGKALSQYSALDEDSNYDEVKPAIRRRRSEVDGRSSKLMIALLGLQSLTDDVDIDGYLIAFERSMRFDEIEKDEWMKTPHGGTAPETNEIVTHICSCHNFFSLSSVQILLLPACCLLCVL